MGGVVKLLGTWTSPYAMRPRIALNLKSVHYEFLQDPYGSNRSLLHEYNPVYKKIPVLIHNQRPICESMVIVQYIEDVWPTGPSLFPVDPYDRAIARFWMAYIDDKLFPSLTGVGRGEPGAIEQAVTVFQHLEENFEKCSKGKSFFNGEAIGLLDIALGCFLPWTRATESILGMKLFDPAKMPCLAGWAERFCADDAVKKVMPSTEKMVEYGKMLHAKYNPAPN
ncbi:hypothetical protein MRB53_005202 [Persea americana]|uniref:Uncharacterized protein n=1 Tax=Persea americana TaxID=3435 RepID=A0ACC2MDN6_PERAE|nr:hypothetical protein MRB53_005202 [Persea americana]|eukprot:TRINITY_DN13578_c0_g1_i1.p1 TRINITY_DN13578_c0_g1~~TRINITY_DN13578_c0_g1_i1.p1  ORF type:complete len:224 (-),score=26.09 TRINITY_DN13578_c0_g1_i1:151-822(-)